MAKIPDIEITFKQLAASVIERSERGIAILIVRDATDTTEYRAYKDIAAAEADAEKYTADNMQAIRDVFQSAPFTVAVVRIGVGDTIAEAAPIILRNTKTGWIAFANTTTEDSAELASWIRSQEKAAQTYKAIVYNASAPDNMHVVNFTTERVTYNDSRGEKNGATYIPTLLGKIAAANIMSSVTYGVCPNLIDCAETEDEEAAVAAGKLILRNDGGTVRIVSGCNSLTTVDGREKTEDMQYIETVEAMDILSDDIRTEWKTDYLGKIRNTTDNQYSLIGAINGYLSELEALNVLDPEYENKAQIDVEAQRRAWMSAGHAEVEEYTDQQIINTPFKHIVFLAVDIKILGSMESLRLVFRMF